MNILKNIILSGCIAAAALTASSCGTKVVDADYPSQKIYLPAAVQSNIYTVDQAQISTGSTLPRGRRTSSSLTTTRGHSLFLSLSTDPV